LAPPKGLEPLTDWLTASRSTGLSYGGTATAYALSVQQKYLSLAIHCNALTSTCRALRLAIPVKTL
jgi:hypothetical protein